MPVITRLQERRRVALAAEEERERQVYLAQSQFVHASSGGRIIRVNGVLTHAPPEGVVSLLFLGYHVHPVMALLC